MNQVVTNYALLLQQAKGLFEGVDDFIANASNLSALLFTQLADVNWVGTYLMQDEELVVGPFQGKPACVKIALGKGVCGTAAQQRSTQVVDNVHEFDGHIACDGASNSEIVIPMFAGSALVGVFDIDSPQYSRFSRADQEGLQQLVELLMSASKLRTKQL